MKRIVIEAVEPHEMRPPYQDAEGCGDWYFSEDGDLHIKISGFGGFDGDQAFLFALHELVEAKLCHDRGISQEEVDTFDAAFIGASEPGDAFDSPYRREHRQACLIEFLMADMLGLDGYGEMG